MVIVGAGPAGLCGAWFARKRGWEPLIVDAGSRVGGAWSLMEPTMNCLSPRHHDLLPDGRIPEGAGDTATAAEVVAMLTAFQDECGFEILFGETVQKAERHKHGFRLDVGGEPLLTRRLVAATGEYGAPKWPSVEGLKEHNAVHARTLDRNCVQAGDRVVVVGAGNSGAELAVALAERGAQVTVSSRQPVRRPSGLPKALGLIGWHLSGLPLRWQPNRGGCTDNVPVQGSELWASVRSGVVSTAGETVALLADGVRTRDGQRIQAEHVVFCTGYRRDNAWLGDLIKRDADGYPTHDDGIVTEAAGLALLGVPCLRTWRSGFLRGFSDDARTVIGRLA